MRESVGHTPILAHPAKHRPCATGAHTNGHKRPASTEGVSWKDGDRHSAHVREWQGFRLSQRKFMASTTSGKL